MGRKRKDGKRDKGGRLLKVTRVPPNDRVRERIERFSHKLILGGKAGHDCFDGPGQLHAMGYFHGHGHEPEVIRDALREYGELYFRWYAQLQPKTAEIERHSRGEPNTAATRDERRFMELDRVLPLASFERKAIHRLTLDHWGSDDVAPFVERLVNQKMAMLGLSVAGYLADQADHDLLGGVLRAAFSLIEGKLVTDWFEQRRAA
jgi:hypothetical protein